MKRILYFSLLMAGMYIASPAVAQNNEFTREWSTETREVIGSIGTLKDLSNEVEAYLTKIEGKNAEYTNANADTHALVDKYARELETQMGVYKDDTRVYAVLQAELNRVKKQYLTSK